MAVTANKTPGAPERAPDQPGESVLPIIRWVGGKRWLVGQLVPAVRVHLAVTGGNYIEPFVGGGAIALALALPNMLLGDSCIPLITMYRAIQRNPSAVAWALQGLVARGQTKEAYLLARASNPKSVVLQAARFLYLSALSFNGLYRENNSGGFNVPYGRSANGNDRSFPTLEELTALSAALKTSTIVNQDALVTIGCAKDGDVIYADPPYYDTFAAYTAGGYSDAAHALLARALCAAAARGATVVASNADAPYIRELYAWAQVETIDEHHSVAANGARRGKKPAVLIFSKPALVLS